MLQTDHVMVARGRESRGAPHRCWSRRADTDCVFCRRDAAAADYRIHCAGALQTMRTTIGLTADPTIPITLPAWVCCDVDRHAANGNYNGLVPGLFGGAMAAMSPVFGVSSPTAERGGARRLRSPPGPAPTWQTPAVGLRSTEMFA
jgi:hypothetical protein